MKIAKVDLGDRVVFVKEPTLSAMSKIQRMPNATVDEQVALAVAMVVASVVHEDGRPFYTYDDKDTIADQYSPGDVVALRSPFEGVDVDSIQAAKKN